MALDHIGLIKHVTCAIHMTGLGSDLVLHGLSLRLKLTTTINEQNAQAIGFNGLNKE
ncbi:hypothetical protein [Noviherbaspirillum humi]|uniref:hypothetical protein n=1 Tax=Noviherbaspirillum humi TaxID=1688639 RepID=UPI0015963D51|nr:hypothetical protein [Noviherbaspirillum humi]